MENQLLKTLEDIKLILLSNKKVLTVKELSAFTGWSESHIYKLTMAKILPHYKMRENGKMLFFKRKEIEKYMTACKKKTQEEIKVEASSLSKKR